VKKSDLADQAARDQFAIEVELNCAMIAPAGVGKTHSIVERVWHLSQHPQAHQWLTQLVVVTYANRAALELQERVRARITGESTSADLIPALNQAFFGTIHSFCVRLLQKYGHFIGVPSRIDLLEQDDDDRLWMLFLQKLGDVASALPPSQQVDLLRYVAIDQLLGLARKVDPGLQPPTPTGDCPAIVADEVLNYVETNNTRKRKIEADQNTLHRWIESRKAGLEFLPLPMRTSETSGFMPVWDNAFAPLRNWLQQASLFVVVSLARKYRDFRVSHALLTYDDQVALAAELLRHPEAAKLIRSENYRIILDEAQDTDPDQFNVLIEAARHASGDSEFPRPGHFSMVGDRQQSIHGKRADLNTYLERHQHITTPPHGRESTLFVTHRCSSGVVAMVNQFFPRIFHPAAGQTEFVPLEARPQAPPGKVIRWPVENEFPVSDYKKVKALDQVTAEARQLARFLKEKGPHALGADSWRDVAILCGRKDWFSPLAAALKQVQLEMEIQKHRDIMGEDPAFAWFTALIWIMAHPRDGYEIVGVLREVFGCSDEDLASHANRVDDRFQILQAQADCSTIGSLSQFLHQLFLLRQQAITLPLRACAEAIITTVELRDRLALISDPAKIDQSLASLLTRAAVAEMQGITLVEWATQLRRDFYRASDAAESTRNAIQILSSHKAKGLEWQVVIIPFLFHKMGFPNENYPRFVRKSHREMPRIAFKGDEDDDNLKEAIGRQNIQETERLLYVSCTRAKNTLILADDLDLFRFDPEKKGISFGRLLLGQEQANRDLWEKLPQTLDGVSPVPTQKQDELPLDNGQHDVSLALPDLKSARVHAADFTRRTTPHQLARYPAPGEPEERREQPADLSPAADIERGEVYGTWWHETMELMPWSKPVAEWNTLFVVRQKISPQPDRAGREWKLFLESSLAGLLQKPGLSIKPETPFLWKDGPQSVIEGITDIACFDPVKKEWLIVDWKTNRLADGGMTRLREIYVDQIGAYVRAWRAIFGGTVRGGLYSTEIGQWQEL
jgi:ATP-dependent helicase/nuclease subunit A